MSYQKDSSHDGSKQRWIEDTHAARRKAEEIRRQIPPEWVQTAPYDVPEEVDFYNRMLFEYASHIRPHRDIVSRLWEEELTSVEVPKNGSEVDLGAANPRGEVDFSRAFDEAETTTRMVSLARLRQDWVENNRAVITVRYMDPWKGEETEPVGKILYLPVRAADAVRDQLNDCVEEIGWLPDAETPDYEAGDDEVLTHGD